MHEMAIAQSLLDLALAEAQKNNCNRLLRLRVEYGAIAGLMPDALRLCFEALTKNSRHEKAQLELVEIPLELKCPFCNTQFGAPDIWAPCPQCGENFGHSVIHGRELLLAQLEADRA